MNTLKHTCDRNGNWFTVPARLERVNGRFVEALPAPPEPTDPAMKRMDVETVIQTTTKAKLMAETTE